MASFILSFQDVRYYYSMSGISGTWELAFYCIHKHIIKGNQGVNLWQAKCGGVNIPLPSAFAAKYIYIK